jgi:hypothetical protein
VGEIGEGRACTVVLQVTAADGDGVHQRELGGMFQGSSGVQQGPVWGLARAGCVPAALQQCDEAGQR